jgi:hypothetical protein
LIAGQVVLGSRFKTNTALPYFGVNLLFCKRLKWLHFNGHSLFIDIVGQEQNRVQEYQHSKHYKYLKSKRQATNIACLSTSYKIHFPILTQPPE